ncbi:MAG: PDZ domain-containing protein [Taibaiella sp.]|nr:PDZ domain-containing protein [Taibaiella sp.]
MNIPFARILTTLLLPFVAFVANAQTIGGIGATLKLDTTKNGSLRLVIQSVADNSPAAKAHLKNGDYIIAVDGQSCQDRPLEESVGKIRGNAGTNVTLKISDNPDGTNAKDYQLTRATIQIVPPPDPLTSFSDECDKAVAELKKAGYKIVKNVNSDCGDYFFSFDADVHTYHVAVISISLKQGAIPPDVWLYDSNNEPGATKLKVANTSEQGQSIIHTFDGHISMKAKSVGIVKTLTSSNACRAMRIVVYR